MPALPQRHQHLPHQLQTTLPSPPSSQNVSFDELSQQFFDQKLLYNYLESQKSSYSQPTIVDNDPPTGSNSFMTSDFSFDFNLGNPSIRIQHSTPTPHFSTSAHSMLPTQHANSNADAFSSSLQNWPTSSNNAQHSNQSLQTPRTYRTHQRASSSSSIGSNGSQYQANAPSTSYDADQSSRTFSNHLPTPTDTPVQDCFTNNTNTYNNFTPNTSSMDSTMAAHFSMKQALMDQHVPEDEVPGFAHSARHSVSSFGHDSPATPHTSIGEDFEEKLKMPSNDVRQPPVPKLERTLTDVAADNFYDPNAMLPQTQSMPQSKPTPSASLLSPYRHSNPNDIVQRTLQAAQQARSQSPVSACSRGMSPFRQNSPYRQPSNSFSSPRVRLGTAAQAREQKMEADAAYAMKPSFRSSEEAEPKTISPKEALLDYRADDEDSKVPLFPSSGTSESEHQYHGGDQYRNATESRFDTTSGQSYQSGNWATPQFSSNYSTSSSTTSQTPSSFPFASPAIAGNMHRLAFNAASQYRSTSNNMPLASDPAPEFPAHLTSMESSASEADPQGSQTSNEQLQKPVSSAADSGTYTCTYHGCTLRFGTPQKLQKHKRESHRNPNAATVPSAASAELLEHNSQAGPHKCERINPTTGKPCNTVFSRPYDLTRHEDTIHNARKQKVRCALCVEEKTFSRNDALTRHMRVVHPEIDFPGKHRRRGGNHD